jgi:hypothetical protein
LGSFTAVGAGKLSRRTFIQRSGLAALVAAVPGLLQARGLVDEALAQSTDLTTDTLNGLVAFMFPGDDPYSVAQGVTGSGPGGVGAGVVSTFIQNLDNFVPVGTPGLGDRSIPASGGVATLLNAYATQVNPAAAGGPFPSAFARLTFAQKAEVFRRFEGEAAAAGTELRFVAGILPGFAAFLCFSEAGVFDASTRSVTQRPVGWDVASYGGPAEGHREHLGYWKGKRKAIQSAGYRRRRRRQRLGRRRSRRRRR